MKRQSVLFLNFLSEVFLLLASLSVLAALASAQQTGGNNPSGSGRSGATAASHTVRGKIFMPSGGLPEQRIRVVLELSTGGIAQETFSDSVGNFEFRNLPNNSYRVTVPTDGHVYETTQELVEVFGNFARTFPVQVYLKDKNSEPLFKTKDKILSVADLQEVPKAAKKAYEQGVKLARNNKPEDASAKLQEAIKIFPDYLYALNKLGEQYSLSNKPADARAMYERAIAINPKFALAHINLGIHFVHQRQFDEAITALENGIRLDSTYPMGYLNLGLALMSKTPPEFDRAEKELVRALEMGKKEMLYVRKHLFNLNLRQQRMDKAAAQLEAYLRADPEAPDAEQVRQMLGKVKKAMAQQAAIPKQQ
jgi:tetratricopeptide (TPR) repeat protein